MNREMKPTRNFCASIIHSWLFSSRIWHLFLAIIAFAPASINYNGVNAFVVSEQPSSLKNNSPDRKFTHKTAILDQEHHRYHDTLFLASTSVYSPSNDPRDEPRVIYKVFIDLPLGIVLEEMDSDLSPLGVVIVGINEEGNAVKYNADLFSKMKSKDNSIDVSIDQCICIRDKIMAVNGVPCHDKGLDDVIGLISSTESSKVTLELGRLQGSTVVNYYGGMCISAKPAESYGFLAQKCGVDIEYECRTGNCQTCMRWMEFPDKDKEDEGKGNLYERTIFHCVGKVPRGYRWLHVLDPYS